MVAGLSVVIEKFAFDAPLTLQIQSRMFLACGRALLARFIEVRGFRWADTVWSVGRILIVCDL